MYIVKYNFLLQDCTVTPQIFDYEENVFGSEVDVLSIKFAWKMTRE